MSNFFESIFKKLGWEPGQRFGASGIKRKSEEREDEMDVAKISRVESRRLAGETIDEEMVDAYRKQGSNIWSCFAGTSSPRVTSTSRKFSATSALLSKHVGGWKENNDNVPRSATDSLTFQGDISKSTSYAQNQFLRKYDNTQPSFVDRNVEIEISDDEDVSFLPEPISMRSNYNTFRFRNDSSAVNGTTTALKSPNSTQKPIPALIPRSTVGGRMRSLEKRSRFSSLLDTPSIFTRPSITGHTSSNIRTSSSTTRKSYGISKENRFSRSAKMLNSVLKDTYNLTQKRNYQKLLEVATMTPSVMKPRLSALESAQNKPKIVETINLEDYDSVSDDEIPIMRVKSPTKAATIVQESLNSSSRSSNSKRTPIPLPINSKSITVSSSESASRVSTPEITPVNTILTKFRAMPYYPDDWLSKQQEKNRQVSEERKREIEKAEKETEEYEAERKKELAEFLRNKMKDISISQPPIFVEDSDEEEAEIPLPVLTAEQQNLVRNVTTRGSPSEVIISKFNLNITRNDLSTLIGDNWLNDEVINFYMNLLTERSTKSENNNLPKVYAMNTFFAVRLLQTGHAGVKRWTRKVDIFAHDIIPVPVHVSNVHWCMAIIDLRNQTIRYYDSMGQPNMRILDALEEYLKSESLDKKQRPFDTSGWEKQCMSECPRQMNGSDCGVFSCMFAEYITRGSPITFTQTEMPYFRQKMILEIATGKLLL